MNYKSFFLILLVLLSCKLFSQSYHHKLNVEMDYENKKIKVVDTVIIRDSALLGEVQVFALSKNFKVQALNADIVFDEATGSNPALNYYKVLFLDTINNLIPIKYEGSIDGAFKTQPEYGKSFKETKGIISEKGAYLSGATHWVPNFNQSLFSFEMKAVMNRDYNLVSQGKRELNIIEANKRIVIYHCPYPMEEVYWIGGKWTEYHRQIGQTDVYVFLRKEDEKLANQYLGVTATYLPLYEKLIGSFPYSKFALVENFWETGYGMPSFTLLGSKVIRFPWIVYSSYPHELLHNYWGNSVYVDYSSGNWCEGITAYMADHLMKEQKGDGAVYRREALQKYSNYVDEEDDFPLSEFHSRHSSSEEAVGYGKSLMLFHMLRMKYGDDLFLKSLQHLYRNFRFQKASFTDIQNCFEDVTGDNLQWYFDQWVTRKGAPELKLEKVMVSKPGEQLQLAVTISQVQGADAFRLNIPIYVYYENRNKVHIEWVDMSKRKQTFKIFSDTNQRPLRIDVDPEYDVFRKLGPDELPVTVSTLLGKNDHLIVMPKNADMYVEYYEFADYFVKYLRDMGAKPKLTDDANLHTFPKNKVLWVLGDENKFAVLNKYFDAVKEALSPETVEKMNELDEDGTLIYTYRNEREKNQVVCFIKTNTKYSLTNLPRKLPHYGKYSILGFSESYLQNELKATVPVLDSPLWYELSYKSKTPEISTRRPERKALGE